MDSRITREVTGFVTAALLVSSFSWVVGQRGRGTLSP